MPDCYKCKYRGSIPGDAHSCCNHPKVAQDSNVFGALMDMIAGKSIGAAIELSIKARKKGKEVKGAEVRIMDKNGEEVLIRRTDAEGSLEVELQEYTVDGDKIAYLSPYTVSIKKKKEEVILDTDQEITMKVK